MGGGSATRSRSRKPRHSPRERRIDRIRDALECNGEGAKSCAAEEGVASLDVDSRDDCGGEEEGDGEKLR